MKWSSLFLILVATAAAGAEPRPHVVRIEAREGNTISVGSGVLVEPDLVLTNWHVVRDERARINVRFQDSKPLKARFLAGDSDWDIAAVQLEVPCDVQPVVFARSNPRVGDRLTIAGYGGPAMVYREQSGPVTDYLQPTSIPIRDFVELAAVARDGDSGGPIFNTDGELAGVLFGTSMDGRVPGAVVSRLREFLSRDAVKLKGRR